MDPSEFNESIHELIQNVDHIKDLLNDRKSAKLILETTKLLLTKWDDFYLTFYFTWILYIPNCLLLNEPTLIKYLDKNFLKYLGFLF
jgi:hypothetical protein